MKALLDILNEEKNIVRQINRFDSAIESRYELFEHIRRIGPDCDAKERDLERLVIEIDILKNNRNEYQELLRGIQQVRAGYLHYLSELS